MNRNELLNFKDETNRCFDEKQSIDLNLFESIIGYDDIKKIFKMSLSSDRAVHILLVGPPASAKTLFMLEFLKLERSYFTLGSHSTKAGMIDYLFDFRPRYLLVDEIEHMPYKDQTSLLSIMETGIITETKSQKTRSTQLKTWIFATCNNKEKLLSPLLSRFIIFHLKPYNLSKFIEVSNGILIKNDVPFDVANEISHVVWNKLKSRDIRDCIKIARLAKTIEDVEWIAKTLKQYRK
ncbi:MAG TPA: sigma 54-interacting transcriptional regulator [Nitrososphaeraceae archaeon]|jgi:replication-associated recombination protein RarA|nr:sigma 54-interacting transcriptional regulator [Nitrososphaeraceae archaeon]